MGFLFHCLIILFPIFAFAINPIDKYLKFNNSLVKVSQEYLSQNSYNIDREKLYNLLVEKGVYDADHIAFSGKFKTLEEFKKYINTNTEWRIKKYTDWGYFSKEGVFFAILLKRYVELESAGFANGRSVYVIRGRFADDVKSVMAYVHDPRRGIFHVLPSLRIDNTFEFRFSGSIAKNKASFELMVDTKHNGRRVANIIRLNTPITYNNKIFFQNEIDAKNYLIQKINDERVFRGLNPLTPSDKLEELAKKHATRMAATKKIFHSDLVMTGLELEEFYTNLSENVGAGSYLDSIHMNFANSPAHLKNILDEDIKDIGIGIFYSTNGLKPYLYVAQLFMNPLDSGLQGSFSKESFISFINTERKKQSLPLLKEDLILNKEARTFIKNGGELSGLGSYFKLSRNNLKRFAYNKIVTQAIFSTKQNPAYFDKAFTHLTLIPPDDNDVKKSTIILLASYK